MSKMRPLPLQELFDAPDEAALLARIYSTPNGVILIAGTTSAGKTVLAAALADVISKHDTKRVAYVAPIEEYVLANCRFARDRPAPELNSDDIVFYDVPRPNWTTVAAIASKSRVIATMHDNPECWDELEASGVPICTRIMATRDGAKPPYVRRYFEIKS